MPRSSHLAYLLSLASIGYAQNVVPFSVTGGLEDCSAGTEYNAGGSISVNAFNIQVPKNLIVQFPTVFAPFKDLCSAGARGFETTVVGNIVGTQAIAGQITVAQRFGLEGSQGYISAINPDGSLQIQGGPKVTLNDPDGLFGPKVTSNPMWVADTSSPSVTSFSGFPMCIPYDGNKDKCLTSNRGSGQSFTPQDQLSMVPLKVGDFIEYSGLRTDSGILASDITCISLHITTSGRADGVNYIRVEDMLIGVPDTAANVEFAGIKAVGFLSSCNDAIVTISAIDVDPCTGKETYREIGTARPKVETRCKWEAKIDHPGKAPFTREYRITTNSPIKETKDGLQAGEFITAVTEWIFPELDTPGNNPPPFPFKDITDVVQGTVLDGKQYGQLDPFPGASPGSPSKACKPEDLITATPTPSASATPSAEASGQASDASAAPTSAPAVTPPQASVAAIANAVRVGADFVLTGSNTESKYTNADLNFAWSQISPASPSPTIGNGNSPTATVNAGRVSGTTDTPFVYELTVSLKSNSAVSSKANVTVKVNPSMADTVAMTAYTYSNSQSGTIAVSCNSNVINTDNKKMQLSINPGAAGARLLDMTQNGPGKWQYNARSFGNRPNTLKCVSDLKGESALRQGTQTTARKRRWASL